MASFNRGSLSRSSTLGYTPVAPSRNSSVRETPYLPELALTNPSLHLVDYPNQPDAPHEEQYLPELDITRSSLHLRNYIDHYEADSDSLDSNFDDPEEAYDHTADDASHSSIELGSQDEAESGEEEEEDNNFQHLDSDLSARTPDIEARHATIKKLRVPRTASGLLRSGTTKKISNPNLVTWHGPSDSTNPKNWPKSKKWTATLLVSCFTFISPAASTMVAPALDSIADEYEIESQVEEVLVMSIFLLAYAVGPFLWGPLSEVFGRVRVLQSANLVFLLFNTVCGFAQTKEQMMAFRFLSGIGGSAPQAIGGGVLSDCFRAEERGAAIAVYSLMPFISPAIGPIVGGYITQNTTWRWVFFATSIFDAIVQLLAFVLLKETYPPVILLNKARQLRKETGNQDLQTEREIGDHGMKKILMKSLIRPFIMIGTQPALQLMSIFRAYLYGLMYLVLATFPMVFEEAYDQDVGRASLNYLSLGIGFVAGLQVSHRMQDSVFKYCKEYKINPNASVFSKATWTLPHRRGPPPPLLPDTNSLLHLENLAENRAIQRKPVPLRRAPTRRFGTNHDPTAALPEYRLPLALPFSILVPIGLFWYGWAAQNEAHWILPNMGAAIFAFGLIICFNCAQAYVVDTYTTYAASATGAAAFVRTMAGFSFPLFAPAMYDHFGVGWGNSLLAFLSLVIGIVAPVMLWRWGSWLRSKSTYCVG